MSIGNATHLYRVLAMHLDAFLLLFGGLDVLGENRPELFLRSAIRVLLRLVKVVVLVERPDAHLRDLRWHQEIF